MKKLIFLILTGFIIFGFQAKYSGVPKFYHTLLDSAMDKAGANSAELQKALNEAPKAQKEGMAYLISYMPKRDLTTLSAAFLLENTDLAYKAREKYKWCAELPDSVFFNEVLPYASISETRDAWRKDFFERFAKYADGQPSMVDAIFAIARKINKEVEVEYNTKRSKVDLSPLEAMKEHMATCTGLSIILTDAFRAVGIPSRLAGTAMWTNFKGNHTWSEVWLDKKWQFIEFYPDTLDKSWFVADAGKADPDNLLHWIYAVSYKPTNLYYYPSQMGHLISQLDLKKLPEEMRTRYERMKSFAGRTEPYIWGVNVTQRYLDIYKASLASQKLSDQELMANIVVFKDKASAGSESRVSCRVDLYEGDKVVDFGYSPRKTDDMNQFLKFKLKKNSAYKLVVTNPEFNINQSFPITTGTQTTEDFPIYLNN